MLTAVLYAVVFGVIFLVASLEVPWIALVLAVVCIYFGWKALSRITPNMFVIMSVGKWVAYYLIKGFIAFFLGLFVVPYIIGKWLANKISSACKKSLNEE